MPSPQRHTAHPALPRGFLRPGETPGGRVYVIPMGRAPDGAVSECEVVVRSGGGVETGRVPAEAALAWAREEGAEVGAHVRAVLERHAAPVAPWCGLSLARPRIMGVVNVTPDSFSDGGETPDAAAAVARGAAFFEAGADIVDVGGESTRPGAARVPAEEELRRVVPVVRGLAGRGLVSIDSRRAEVMRAALDAGAAMVNDITALAGDAAAPEVVRAAGAGVVLMHMRGEPATMQRLPRYADAALDVYDFLAARLAACQAAGIGRADIAVDPGIGFGKTVAHNLRILSRLALFRGLGCPLVLGVSRKSFIGRVTASAAAGERLGGSLAAGLAGVMRGAQVLRVHDVAATRQALDIWSAIEEAPEAE